MADTVEISDSIAISDSHQQKSLHNYADLCNRVGIRKPDENVLVVFSGEILTSASRTQKYSEGSLRVIANGQVSYLEAQFKSVPWQRKFLVHWANATIPNHMKRDEPRQFCFMFKDGDRCSNVMIKFHNNDRGIRERLQRIVDLFHENFGGRNKKPAVQSTSATNNSSNKMSSKVDKPKQGVRVDGDDENAGIRHDQNKFVGEANGLIVQRMADSFPTQQRTATSDYTNSFVERMREGLERSEEEENARLKARHAYQKEYIAARNEATNEENAENCPGPSLSPIHSSPMSTSAAVCGGTFGFVDGGGRPVLTYDGINQGTFHGIDSAQKAAMRARARTQSPQTTLIGRGLPSYGLPIHRLLNAGIGSTPLVSVRKPLVPLRNSRDPRVRRQPNRGVLGVGKFEERQPILLDIAELPPQRKTTPFRSPYLQSRSGPERLLSPSTSASTSYADSRKGFSNIGNSCYMNVVLQTLLNLDLFCDRLQRGCQSLDGHLPHDSLTRAMWQLQQMKDEGISDKKREMLRQVKKSVQNVAFDNYSQQDSHEFLTSVLDQIRVELTAASRLADADTANIELAMAIAADTPTPATSGTHIKEEVDEENACLNDGSCALLLKPSASAITVEPLTPQELDAVLNHCATDAPAADVIAQTFGFNMQQLIKCISPMCDHVTRRTQFFAELAVADTDVRRKKRSMRLEDLLTICHGEEPIEHYKCEHCGSVGAINSTHTTHLPDIMVIQVKRYVYNIITNTQRKSQRAVVFPKILALDKHYEHDPMPDTVILPDVKKEVEEENEKVIKKEEEDNENVIEGEEKEEKVLDKNNNEQLMVKQEAIKDVESGEHEPEPRTSHSEEQQDDSVAEAGEQPGHEESLPDTKSPVDCSELQSSSATAYVTVSEGGDGDEDDTAGGFITDDLDDESMNTLMPFDEGLPPLKFVDDKRPKLSRALGIPGLLCDGDGSGNVKFNSSASRIRRREQSPETIDEVQDTPPTSQSFTTPKRRKSQSRFDLSKRHDTKKNTTLRSDDLYTIDDDGTPVEGGEVNASGGVPKGVKGDGTGIDRCTSTRTIEPEDDLQKAMDASLQMDKEKKCKEALDKRHEERELEQALEASQLQHAIEESRQEEDKRVQLQKEMAELDAADIEEVEQETREEYVAATGNERFAFRLTAVLSHIGDTNNSGHYICDVYKPGTGTWQSCDDSSVTTIPEEQVLTYRQKTAYILLYSRIKDEDKVKMEVNEEPASSQ